MNTQNKKFKNWKFIDIFKDPYLYITLIVAGLIAFLLTEKAIRAVNVDLGVTIAGVGSALLGIVIAGFSIFLAFMDKAYIALIDTHFGIGNELFPIKVTTFLSILSLLFSIALVLVGGTSTIIFRLFFLCALWSYLYLLSQIWELVKWLVSHARLRATQIRKEMEQNKKGNNK